MKIEVPFLALCLAAFTNLDLILAAPAPGSLPGEVSKLGHKSSITDGPVKLASAAVGSQGWTSHGITAETAHQNYPQEMLNDRLMSAQEAKAFHGFTHRPKNAEDVRAIPEHDLKKIQHEDHLKGLDADGAIAMTNRLIDHTSVHLADRQRAFDAIRTHGGTPGMMGSGRPEAQEHHKQYANTMKELKQLKGPLLAAEHRAGMTGELDASILAKHIRSAIDHGWKSPKKENQEFINHVGHSSLYHPQVNAKEQSHLLSPKASENKVAISRL